MSTKDHGTTSASSASGRKCMGLGTVLVRSKGDQERGQEFKILQMRFARVKQKHDLCSRSSTRKNTAMQSQTILETPERTSSRTPVVVPFGWNCPRVLGGRAGWRPLGTAGRSLAWWVLREHSGRGVDCNSECPPAGRYLLVLDSNRINISSPDLQRERCAA